MKDLLIVGDTLEFLTTVTAYPPADGWTLKYRLVPRSSGTAIEITATTSGSDYLVQVGSATTATWTAGEYSWLSWVEKTGARYTVDTGLVTLQANPATTASWDARSHAQKVLEAIEAVMENRATLDQMEYTIGGRSLRRTPLADLIKLHRRYQALVANEEAAQKLAAGLQVGGKIQFRF